MPEMVPLEINLLREPEVKQLIADYTKLMHRYLALVAMLEELDRRMREDQTFMVVTDPRKLCSE